METPNGSPPLGFLTGVENVGVLSSRLTEGFGTAIPSNISALADSLRVRSLSII